MEPLRVILWKAEELAPLLDSVTVLPCSAVEKENSRGYFQCYLQCDDEDCFVEVWYAPADEKEDSISLSFVPPEGTPEDLKKFGVNLDEVGWVVSPQDLELAQIRIWELQRLITQLRSDYEKIQL